MGWTSRERRRRDFAVAAPLLLCVLAGCGEQLPNSPTPGRSTVLTVIFEGDGTWNKADVPPGFSTNTAMLHFRASWDFNLPDVSSGFAPPYTGLNYQGSLAVPPPELSGTTTGLWDKSSAKPGFTCTGPPVLRPDTQNPYAGYDPPGVSYASQPVVHMWAEAMRGGRGISYCDGLQFSATGDAVMGRPGSDGIEAWANFDVDLAAWSGKPAHTATLAVAGDFGPSKFGVEVHWKGTITLSAD